MASDQLLYLKTTAPTANDDSSAGYKVLDIWGDTTNDLIYQAIDVSVGAASWIEVVGRTLTQILTNKTINLASNTLTGTTAEFNTALSDGNFATLAGTEVLSGKTLTLPQINDTSSDHQYVFVPSELAADRNVTLPLLGSADEFTFNAHTQTLTNKRVTPRPVTVTVSATPSINTDDGDVFRIGVTGDLIDLAITSLTTNLTGTPTHSQSMIIEYLDDGTPRAITHGASFRAGTSTALITTTIANKLIREAFKWDSADSVWDKVANWVEE